MPNSNKIYKYEALVFSNLWDIFFADYMPHSFSSIKFLLTSCKIGILSRSFKFITALLEFEEHNLSCFLTMCFKNTDGDIRIF